MRTAEDIFMTYLLYHLSYQHIRDFFTIEILNILRRGHFAVRYFLHSGSLLEANPIVLAIYYAFIQFPHTFHLNI
jgi:hypothetical protein